MANEPIDRATELGASNNIALAPDMTTPAPPKKSGSSSPTSPEEEREKLNGPLQKTKATLSPPLGQFFINMILQIAAFAAAIAFGVFAVKSIDIARTANEYSASANNYAARALEEARVANQVAMLAVCSQSGDVQNSSFAAFCFRVLNGAPIVMPDAASNLFTKLSTATTSTTTISPSTPIARNISFTKSIYSYSTKPIPTTEPNPKISTEYLRTTGAIRPAQDPTGVAFPAPQSNTGGNQRKTLAIALSLSLLFVICIILVIWFKIRSKRSKPVPPLWALSESIGSSGVQGHGEDQGHGDGEGHVEEQGEVQGNGYPPTNKPSKQWKKRNLGGDWWKTFRAYFLDSTVSTNQE